MIRSSERSARSPLIAVLAFLVLIGAAFIVATGFGWISPLSFGSENHDTQVVNAIERTEEVSLLSLSVQGIDEESHDSKVFGRHFPGTSEHVFIQYEFKAKLGIDGAKVAVSKTGEKAYRVSIPKFTSIGFSDPKFKVATTSGGILRGITPDIDRVEMVEKILNSNAKEKYIESNLDTLEDQAKTFYTRLIKSIDPDVTATFEFAEQN